jgi:Ca2+/Na+ antiporter
MTSFMLAHPIMGLTSFGICAIFSIAMLLRLTWDRPRRFMDWLLILLSTIPFASFLLTLITRPQISIYLALISLIVLAIVAVLLFFRVVLHKEDKKTLNNAIDPLDPAPPTRYRTSIFFPMLITIVLLSTTTITDETALFADIPAVINKDYETIMNPADYLDKSQTELTFIVKGKMFTVLSKDFKDVSKGNVYTVVYLPNCDYVIDILDENGKSLLK